MQLTHEQVQAVKEGEPVAIASPEIGVECVLIRRDMFDQMKAAIDDPRTMYPAVLKAWDADDENPEQYQEYLRDS